MAPVSVVPDLMNWVAILLMLVSGGLPLGIPPASEDPMVSRVAPEECLLYVSWSGMAKPEPASRNQTEQLLAEAEVQGCLADLETRILETLRRQAVSDPQVEALAEPIVTVVKAVLTSPTAVFVSGVDATGKRSRPRGGALVSLGGKAAKVEQALAAIEKALAAGPVKKPGAEAAAVGKPWRLMPIGDKGLAAEWTIKDKCLIVGVGQGEGDKILARMQQNPPAWLTKIRQRLAVPRLSNLAYVNVAGILKVAGTETQSDGRTLLDTLGLTRVRSVAQVTGLDDSGCVSKIHIAAEGELQGLLSMFAGQPLAKEHLVLIPKDASLAAAARLDLAKAYQTILDAIGRAEPRMRDEMLGGIGQWEKRQKLNLSEDILDSLGDVWRVYNSPTEGGLVITGLTAVVNLRDRDRLVAANAKLVFGSLAGGLAKQVAAPRGDRETLLINQFKFGKHTVFFLNTGGGGMPFAPAWCITDTELVVALYPQNVRAYLSRGSGGPADGSLADVPAVAGLFDGDKAPLAVGYTDTAGLFKLIYPIAQIVLQSGFSAMQQDASGADISVLPSALSVVRHLQPTVVSVRRDASGVVMETRQTLPMASGAAILPSVVVAWLTPVRTGSHALPTSQNASMNNLKQILLAMHNHHAAHGRFPAAAAPQKAGQPPVSWRVKLLPYIEENSLYAQYRLDEPWDSMHNKKLIAQMPAVFAAPGSGVSAEGKTNYLAVVGDEYGLAAAEGRRIADFRDGTANTLVVVEVSDAKAVFWTKPEDYMVNKANPVAGLVGLRQGGFLAGSADGSVRRIPAGIDAASLNALFTRAGGEPVNTTEVLRDR